MAVRVCRTMRSRVPCRRSSLDEAMLGVPVVLPHEYIREPVGIPQEDRKCDERRSDVALARRYGRIASLRPIWARFWTGGVGPEEAREFVKESATLVSLFHVEVGCEAKGAGCSIGGVCLRIRVESSACGFGESESASDYRICAAGARNVGEAGGRDAGRAAQSEERVRDCGLRGGVVAHHDAATGRSGKGHAGATGTGISWTARSAIGERTFRLECWTSDDA